MINALLNGIFVLVGGIVGNLFRPIANLVTTLFPSAVGPLNAINDLLSYLQSFVPFALSYLGLNQNILSIIILELTCIIQIPIGVHITKLCIRWYNALKP